MKKINWAFYLAAMSYCNGAIALPGTVDIDGPKTITADKIEYNAKSAEIKTIGNTTITNQSGQTLKLTNSLLFSRLS